MPFNDLLSSFMNSSSHCKNWQLEVFGKARKTVSSKYNKINILQLCVQDISP
jgi:hypothetical protein